MVPQADTDPKAYLDYLDKEMDSLGVLSTFCVGFASLAIDRIVSNTDKAGLFQTLWRDHIVAILGGSALLLAAAFIFYQQRAQLSYYYGGIAISLAVSPKPGEWRLKNWLIEADSWNTWLYYRIGIRTLALGLLVYAYAIYRAVNSTAPPLYGMVALVFAAVAIQTVWRCVILTTYRYEADPKKAFREGNFGEDWKTRGEQPVDDEPTTADVPPPESPSREADRGATGAGA